MTMLGGVELFAQTNAEPAGAPKASAVKIKVAVIGLGAWGREIINTLARMPQANNPSTRTLPPSATPTRLR